MAFMRFNHPLLRAILKPQGQVFAVVQFNVPMFDKRSLARRVQGCRV